MEGSLHSNLVEVNDSVQAQAYIDLVTFLNLVWLLSKEQIVSIYQPAA